MPNIGTRHLAQRAYDIAHEIIAITDDWQMLGDGGCRIVLLHKPTEVIYKVDIEDAYYSSYNNDQELRNARQLARRAARNDGWINEYVRLPKTTGFRINGNLIIAMEYVKGETGHKSKGRFSRRAATALLALGFSDMHGHNFIVDDDGTLWPIDLGSPRSSRAADRVGSYYSGPDSRCLWGAV